jgi:hypothetical protein
MSYPQGRLLISETLQEILKQTRTGYMLTNRTIMLEEWSRGCGKTSVSGGDGCGQTRVGARE